jgi:hypothetical protein
MSKRISSAALVLAAGSSLGGCRAVEAIFKAGAWTGAIMVILFLAALGGVTMVMRR